MSKFLMDVPMDLPDKLESLMPGQILTIVTASGRRFTVIEEDEFNLLVQKAGLERVNAKENGDGS